MGRDNRSGNDGSELARRGPRYDHNKHTFSYDGQRVDSFAQGAPAQEAFLARCEKQHWQFPMTYENFGAKTPEDKERIKNVIRRLNGTRGKRRLPIRFYITKRGEIFCVPR
jgi:hypothetical protein